jgi:hypothetical protein
MLLRWQYPFDDGVVVDVFEIGIVQLPDSFIPVAQREEERDRRQAQAALGLEEEPEPEGRPAAGSGETEGDEAGDAAAAAAAATAAAAGNKAAEEASMAAFAAAAGLLPDPDSANLDIDSLQPIIHRTGHRCEYNVTGSAAYTAFRARVRAHTMVGWGPWGPWSLVTTKGWCACAGVHVLVCMCWGACVGVHVLVLAGLLRVGVCW